MPFYNSVTDIVISELIKLCGKNAVITEREKLENYSHDELNDVNYVKIPKVVVMPADVNEVSGVIKYAFSNSIPIIARGAGTAFTAGSIAITDGIVISLERMNKIIEIDNKNMFITAEAGARTSEVQKAAFEAGFLYAGDPCSCESSFIGGNVATNAGGNKAIKYGTTRRQVYGLEIVTASGEIVNIGGKCMKDSTGYSLLNLIIGSEGTLAVITKVCLKLMPLPKNSLDLLIVFKSLGEAVKIVPEIIASGCAATCIEFMDNKTIRCCEEFLKEKLPHGEIGYYIIVKLEGDSMDQLEAAAVFIDELCAKNGALETLVAEPSRIWKARKAFAEADRAKSLVFSAEDLVVPVSEICAAVSKIDELSKKYGLTVHCAGHAADGNIHANILKENLGDDEYSEKLHKFQDELYDFVYSIGGKLSGEHGIGYKRAKFMKKYTSPAEYEMMKAVKAALDPKNILNPGKIFEI
ncbi:MAG: FAD-binding oxidoreductase [Candidatus Wallbacteria bacterium]